MAMAGLYRRVLPSPPAIDFASSEGKVSSFLLLLLPFIIIETVFFFFFFIFCWFRVWLLGFWGWETEFFVLMRLLLELWNNYVNVFFSLNEMFDLDRGYGPSDGVSWTVRRGLDFEWWSRKRWKLEGFSELGEMLGKCACLVAQFSVLVLRWFFLSLRVGLWRAWSSLGFALSHFVRVCCCFWGFGVSSHLVIGTLHLPKWLEMFYYGGWPCLKSYLNC